MKIPKFRAWNKAEKKMVAVNSLVVNRRVPFIVSGNDLLEDIELLMSTGQFVFDPQTDEETEIFEGDVLLAPNGENVVVAWNEEVSSFQLQSETKFYTFHDISVNVSVLLGNVYENPALWP